VNTFSGRAYWALPRLPPVTTKIVHAAIKLLTGRISLLLILELFAKLSVRNPKETEQRSKGANKEYLKSEC
jgi:hypothetical protein